MVSSETLSVSTAIVVRSGSGSSATLRFRFASAMRRLRRQLRRCGRERRGGAQIMQWQPITSFTGKHTNISIKHTARPNKKLRSPKHAAHTRCTHLPSRPEVKPSTSHKRTRQPPVRAGASRIAPTRGTTRSRLPRSGSSFQALLLVGRRLLGRRLLDGARRGRGRRLGCAPRLGRRLQG